MSCLKHLICFDTRKQKPRELRGKKVNHSFFFFTHVNTLDKMYKACVVQATKATHRAALWCPLSLKHLKIPGSRWKKGSFGVTLHRPECNKTQIERRAAYKDLLSSYCLSYWEDPDGTLVLVFADEFSSPSCEAQLLYTRGLHKHHVGFELGCA